MDDQHTDFVNPQALPPVIDEQAGAIELYRIAIFALAGVGAVGLLGVLALVLLYCLFAPPASRDGSDEPLPSGEHREVYK